MRNKLLVLGLGLLGLGGTITAIVTFYKHNRERKYYQLELGEYFCNKGD